MMIRIPQISKFIPSLPYKGRLGGVWSLGCVGTLFFLLTSCSGELVTNKYCNLQARFSFSPVNSISQLYSSCESMGEWCTVVADGKRFLFTKPDGSQGFANQLQMQGYSGFYMGISGFIVGLPNIPELGEMQSVVTCYDLVCRNCWEYRTIAPRLTLQEGGYAYCRRCQLTYDLNNTGQVSHAAGTQGEANKPLYRYRVYYGNNTLNINNP